MCNILFYILSDILPMLYSVQCTHITYMYTCTFQDSIGEPQHFNRDDFNIIGKRKKRMTEYQTQTLMKYFQANPYMEIEEKHQLARSFNISANAIARWFRHMRHKKKVEVLISKGE